MKTTLQILSLTFFLSFLCACEWKDGSERFTEADSGQSVDFALSKSFEVQLSANPSTGYQWDVSVLPTNILVQTGDPSYKADSSDVGAGGKITYSYETMTRGQGTLVLIYHRPFETGIPPQNTFTLNITVK